MKKQCIRVEIDGQGIINIPRSVEVEDWDEVRTEMRSVEDQGELLGWEPYDHRYECTTEDGETHYYFVGPYTMQEDI